MKIATSWSTDSDTAAAVSASLTDLQQRLGTMPDFLVVYTSVNHSVADLRVYLTQLAPDIAVHGASSCLGAMTESGFHSAEGTGLSLWGVSDPEGDYGVGAVSIGAVGGNGEEAGRQAILAAMEVADRFGEPPALIWLTGVPGYEENILQGIQSVVGGNVPIAGGSSADNDVSGKWVQFSNKEVFSDAVIVTAMYPSTNLHYAFHSGYSLTENSGKITRAEGRTLYEIDSRPAAEVYNEWANGVLGDVVSEGGNVLSMTTLNPLGRRVESSKDLPMYRLAHPDSVTEDRALTLFANVEVGDEIVQMVGTRESLVTRAGRVANSALESGRISTQDIAGALVVYCAGCMLTVQDEMDRVAASIDAALAGNPFVGTFTFGEQGCFANGTNHHGNLMISVVVFEK